MALDLSFLTARPIAHRGLHDRSRGIIENTASAFTAAINGNFAIECDVQRSVDNEAVVFHDFTLDRLTHASGKLDELSAAEIAAITMKDTSDHIGTLHDMFRLVNGRALIVCEIKSDYLGDMRLTERVAALAQSYTGPLVIKSFDPAVIIHWRALGMGIPAGIVGQAHYTDHEYDVCTSAQKHIMANLLHLPQTRPDFLSWHVGDLDTAVPFLWRTGMGKPLMSWTVRTVEQRAMAQKYADQMVFEGFVPSPS